MSVSDDNPYVGPRTFTEAQRHLFFGREREARDLLSLVMSERVVLFYAQSGAGKSSLINTRLRPGLRQEGFEVLPLGRVSGSLPEGITEVGNIFVFNLLLKLDQNQREAATLSQTPLTTYLQQYQAETPQPKGTARVLIIDQFEELLTTNLPHWEERGEFFSQLRQAMLDDPKLWLVLSMREDYVASLDPYARFLPGRLETRFYMQRLSAKAALEAVKNPAQQGGRPFAPGVAEILVDNLRQIRQQGHETGSHIGEFVEPVQLQVVCFQLWEKLKSRPLAEISEQDVLELGDVDTALAQFFEQAVTETVQETGVPELDLRDWFERELITEAGTRGLVYQGKQQSGGLANETVEYLVSKFLLRADVRAGGTWYELVHDRLVGPILKSNHLWRLKQPLIQVAQEWADSKRNPELLLDGQPLTAALSSNWQALGPLVGEFLEASQAAQKAKDEALQAEKEAQRQRELVQAQALAEEQRQRAEEQAQATARLRKLVIGVAAVGVVAVAMAVVAVWFGLQARAEQARVQAVLDISQAASTSAYVQITAEATRQLGEGERATLVADLEAQLTARAESAVATEIGQATRDAGLVTDALATIQAATAEALVDTTPTPAGASPVPTPFPTPTVRGTPTPNLAATATTAALEAQLAQLQATRTASNFFVQTRGVQFTLKGEPFKFIGVNIRGLVHYGLIDDLPQTSLEHRDIQLQAASQMGARVVRVFLAHKDASPEVVGDRLEEVLRLIHEKYPEILILPTLTNRYNDVPFYVQGDHKFFNKGVLDRAFFESGYKENYLPFVEYIVSRFRDEPNIFAWEIGNELKVDEEPELFVAFNLNVANAIRGWDANHLITTGMISTRHAWMAGRPDLQDLLYGSPNINFITLHVYNGNEAPYDIEDDSPLAARYAKPFIIEEAAFDRQRYSNRPEKVRQDIMNWFERGASGYMQWGFQGTPIDIGDSDPNFGMAIAIHPDYNDLFAVYRQVAEALNEPPASAE